MPIYDFLCRDCEHRYDDLIAAVDVAAQTCPECASADVVKLYSPFAVHASATRGAAEPVGCGGGACLPGPAGVSAGGGCCGGGCGGCG